jgi:hypothetical protein
MEEMTQVTRLKLSFCFWPSRKTLCLVQTEHLSLPHSEAWWCQHQMELNVSGANRTPLITPQ